ncbi:alpha/beta hydrolase [Roseovarius sp.]|uniref:alpha/beta hydrolase n=1 Tax=Roseovarius sp. TaxID=1486281 RepID=UPI003565575F
MRVALLIAAVLSALVGVTILGLVIGAFLAPTGGLPAVVGSVVWAPFGPFLLLAALGAFAIGVAARAGGLRRLGGAVVVLSVLGIAGAGLILMRISLAGLTAGATLDLPAMLRLGAMDQPAPDVIEKVRTVGATALHAAIYLPPATEAPAPVIVYIHGGGFLTGTKTETAADLRWFADRGWLVVSVEYRLFGPGSPTWDKAPDDVACALVWIGRNAARFGGDPARLALLGDSAGGNLAINTGFAAAAGRAMSSCGGDIPMPAAIAVQYPAVDPVSIYEEGFPIPGFEPDMLIEGYIGGSPETYPERVAAISSATHLSAEAPPTLIILPQSDSLVVAPGTLAFVRDARAAGVNLELVQIPFANHVFNQIAANSLGNQIGRTVRLRFLAQHFR